MPTKYLEWFNSILLLGFILDVYAAPLDPATDPTDYSWIKNWAAVGDSFTAGIGSGNLYSHNDDSKACSRYDYTYPVIMNRFFGPSVQNFRYPACSGATTSGIYKQIQALPTGLDLVIFTAGGNDLCLSSVISACIAIGGFCQESLDKVNENLSTIFDNNILQLLSALDGKMATNGVVVMMSYAQYFNVDTDACSTEDWTIFPVLGSRYMTKDNRAIYNKMVVDTNNHLETVAQSFIRTGPRMRLKFANWDPWGGITSGRFCEPGASPVARDPSNKNVLFFKTNTGTQDHGELKKRSIEEFAALDPSRELYDGVNGGTIYAQNATKSGYSILSKRDPTDPGCPSGIFPIRDEIGCIFHPSNLGHEVMAAFALEAIADARGDILGVGPHCPNVAPSLKCYSDEASKAYASATALNNNINDFCSWAGSNLPTQAGAGTSKAYYVGSPDEFVIVLTAGSVLGNFNENDCKKSLDRIINACDVPQNGNNPMNWKFGGRLDNPSSWTYAVNIHRANRRYPPPTLGFQGYCHGQYYGVFSGYEIKGGGWSSWDWGAKTLYPSITACVGSTPSNWHFDYFDAPDADGNEWKATFRTPIWVSARCFDNCKVQKNSGGPPNCHCAGTG